jgi:hypothetical protein
MLAGRASLVGRWERTLLRTADGGVDATASVTWLQGPSLFVDLRLPDGGPAEGFAGVLTQAGRVFTWEHDVDLRPSDVPDAGTLEWADGRLVERGVHAAYVEHWRPTTATAVPVMPCWGLRLAGQGGRRAVLVRVGDDLGWAGGPVTDEVSLARVQGNGAAVITRASNRRRAGARLSWQVTADTVIVAVDGEDGVTRSRWRVVHREEAA